MTLLISTLLAIAAYLLKNEVLDPIRSFRAARWNAAVVLVTHENRLANTNTSTTEAKGDIRRLAAEIRAQYQQVPARRLLCRLGMIPSGQAVQTAVSQLIGLSNSNDGAENRERLKEIRKQLEIT
jgi:hypothetical protein